MIIFRPFKFGDYFEGGGTAGTVEQIQIFTTQLKDPEPLLALAKLADSSVNFYVRPWTTAADYWGFLFDTTEK